MVTSKKDASRAAKLLRTVKNKIVASVAGSDLVQAKPAADAKKSASKPKTTAAKARPTKGKPKSK